MKRHHYLPKAIACFLFSLMILNVFTLGRGAKLNNYSSISSTTGRQSVPLADAGVEDPEVNTEKTGYDPSLQETYSGGTYDLSATEVIESDNNSKSNSESNSEYYTDNPNNSGIDNSPIQTTAYSTGQTQTSQDEISDREEERGDFSSADREEERGDFSSADREEEKEDFSSADKEAADGITTPAGSIIFEIPEYDGYEGFKSYESYTALREDSRQGLLQTMAVTDPAGFRKVEDRYLVAIGTHFDTQIGTWVDVILENGTRIPCIVGDIKDDRHTDSNHIFTVHSKCCSEFLVDLEQLDPTVKVMGNCSYLCAAWKSPVAEIIVYDHNQLD